MRKISKAQQHELIGHLIQSKAGRQKLAASLTQPLRYERDYFAIGRKVIFAEDLPDGAWPVYDKDVDVRAFFISETGDAVASVLSPTNVSFPLFEIVALPEIPITQIQDRRYDLVTRAKDKGRSEICKKEDVRVFSVIEAAAEDASNPNNGGVPLAVAFLDSADLADAFSMIEQNDLLVECISINPRDYADIRKFDRDVFDPETQRDVLRTGVLGTIWGAKVLTSTRVTAGKVLITAERETVGRMPVRSDLTVLSADDPKKRTIGFSMFERLGCGIHNIAGTVEIAITRI